MVIASSPDLAEAMGKVQFHDLVRKDANDKERIHIAYAFVGVLTLMHLAYEHWQESIIMENKNGRIIWEEILSDAINPEFAAEINKIFESCNH